MPEVPVVGDAKEAGMTRSPRILTAAVLSLLLLPACAEQPRVIENDGASISIPPGALPDDVAIHVEEVEAPQAPDETHILVGPVFAFTPHGIQFDLPVTITIPFEPGPDLDELGVFRLGAENDTNWITVPGASFLGAGVGA